MKNISVYLMLVCSVLTISGCGDKTEAHKQVSDNSALLVRQDAEKINSSANTPSGSKEVLIPRSVAGDKGRYYLLSTEKKDGIYQTLHKRVGVDSTVFTKTEINCLNMTYRVIGVSEQSVDTIVESPTKWTTLVEGSSKNDLIHFVCKK